MRYGDGGGVNAAGRAKREAVRLAAADMFARDISAFEVARTLEVSTKSVYQWRRAWQKGGPEALASKGPPGPDAQLDASQRRALEQALEDGPAAAGLGEDQRWTLVRVRELIVLRFGITYSPKGVSLVLRAMGWTVQVPDAKASDRDEEAIAAWRKQTWPTVKGRRAGWARGSASWTSPRTR